MWDGRFSHSLFQASLHLEKLRLDLGLVLDNWDWELTMIIQTCFII